ncbi:HNH endonuclease [Oceanibaculum nanhaiense]|uniref:HNH endonuclease n=1 Tax=Oceanibaculum nanhaiense TaxID=1909734 RepID=UPI001FE85209|nr:HNH endonuclease [Oceanibaculum nanhaiense]|tara:strand:- start:517 stop:1473 length:957 start_codon:yes stop_codon:yes gene_type:complete
MMMAAKLLNAKASYRIVYRMSHCVFMLRPDSIYNDSPAIQYQFPKQYLQRASGSVGDWIVYLEPKKLRETRGYFGIARVHKIIPDPMAPGMFYALIEPGSYLDFAEPVPFNDDSGPIERGLLNDEGRLSGRAQAAVRPISTADFMRIIENGLTDSAPLLPRLETDTTIPGLAEDQRPYEFETTRTRLQQLTNRMVRDRIFRRVVLRAYGERCAITGLKFINGGGRAEANAAHIRPVQYGGPDIVNNGIALSGTAHWMFDRGLISLSDDLDILISRQVNDPRSIERLIDGTSKAIMPLCAADRPHTSFLSWHRENCFKH